MRIVAGTFRGRGLVAPPGHATRPTADRARQALFDMLTHAPWAQPRALSGAYILDGFAGTGALGLEALSRGGAHATFFETDRAALRALQANVEACRATAQCHIVRTSIFHPPPPAEPGRCNLVFLDPPYYHNAAPKALAALQQRKWLAAEALIIIETARDEAPPLPGGALVHERPHGAARLWIYSSSAPV